MARRTKYFSGVVVVGLALSCAAAAFAQKPLSATPKPAALMALPTVPDNIPGWMTISAKLSLRRFFVCGTPGYINNIPKLSSDLLVGDMCHAMIEDQLATGHADQLNTTSYAQFAGMLRDPDPVVKDQNTIDPLTTYRYKYSALGKQYRLTEFVDSIAHERIMTIVHLLDSSTDGASGKDSAIKEQMDQYVTVAGAITPLPMNMANLEGLPYYGSFKRKYPKANSIMWGYHWLSNSVFDLLYGKTSAQQYAAYDVLCEQYRETELWRARPVMPMVAETSPAFASKFPQIANMVDNFHMMHDLILDILATDTFSDADKDEQIRRVIWWFSAAAHKGESAGDAKAGAPLHDHRFIAGVPGLGMMRGATRDLMYMPRLGWMRLADCHHCSMPLVDGDDAWRDSRVSADGWTMRVRCPLCARDMAAETKGKAVIQLATEDTEHSLVLISDDQGNLKTDMPGAVFLEVEGGHAGCSAWSQAFTSRAAFDAYVGTHPEYKNAKPLTLAQWSGRIGKKPNTYVKPKEPVANPYSDPPMPKKVAMMPAKRSCCQK